MWKQTHSLRHVFHFCFLARRVRRPSHRCVAFEVGDLFVGEDEPLAVLPVFGEAPVDGRLLLKIHAAILRGLPPLARAASALTGERAPPPLRWAALRVCIPVTASSRPSTSMLTPLFGHSKTRPPSDRRRSASCSALKVLSRYGLDVSNLVPAHSRTRVALWKKQVARLAIAPSSSVSAKPKA